MNFITRAHTKRFKEIDRYYIVTDSSIFMFDRGTVHVIPRIWLPHTEIKVLPDANPLEERYLHGGVYEYEQTRQRIH